MHSATPAVCLLRGVWSVDCGGFVSKSRRQCAWCLHTTGASGRVGAIVCRIPLVRARRNGNSSC